MKIFSKIFGRKIKAIQPELPKVEQVEQTAQKATKKIEQVGHELTEAVKAKYYTRIATAKNGGEVEMKFYSDTDKLRQWRRHNPDGTITEGKINSYLSPVLRTSIISQGDKITQKTKGSLGSTAELAVKKFDLAEYPKINVTKTNKIFIKGSKKPIINTQCNEEFSTDFLQLSKEDYRNLLTNQI